MFQTGLFEFGILDLEFVSDFDIRISDFSTHLLGSGFAGLGYFVILSIMALPGYFPSSNSPST